MATPARRPAACLRFASLSAALISTPCPAAHLIDAVASARVPVVILPVFASKVHVNALTASATVSVAVTATFCDPSGAGVNDVTGTSAVRELRGLGILTKYRRSGVLEGIELIRRAIRAGDGKSRLIISPKCVRLIEALRCYHYPDGHCRNGGEMPLKDGVYDHAIDALRYYFVNKCRRRKTVSRVY